MDEIKQFKEENGFVKYSNKELIGALHVKIDKINTRLLKGDKRITRMETNILWLKTSVFALYGLLGAFLIKPIREILKKLIGG